MDDKRLKALLTAVECGSFNKAAEKLGYTQSGLTHMMDRLEEDLGCPILDRNFRGVKLTEDGEALLPYIRKVMEACDELQAEAEARGKKAASMIKIGCFSSFSHAWLPKLLTQFNAYYPDVEIDVIIGGSSLWKRLADDDIQLALVDHRTKPEFEFIPLKRVKLAAAVPMDFPHEEGKPITMEELLVRPIISGYDQYAEDLLPKDQDIKKINVDSSDDSSLLQMVESGLGVAVLSELSLRSFKGNIKVIPLAEDAGYTAGIAVKSLKKADLMVKNFVKVLKNTEF